MKFPASAVAALGAGTVLTGVIVAREVSRRGGPAAVLEASAPAEPPPAPVAVSPGEAALIKAMRPVIVQAFQQEMGRTPNPAELQYVSAVAWRETRYGTGWPPNMAGAHNWGAVQCDMSKEGPETCIPHEDHTSGGTTFKVGFKRYASDVEGAAHTIKHVLKLRPETAKALAEKNPSAYRADYAMRREKYYGGFCPKANGKYGVQAATDSFAKPDASEGTKACAEEAIGSAVDTTMRHAQAISQTLGEPLALRRGTYADADAWWRKENPPKVAGALDDMEFLFRPYAPPLRLETGSVVVEDVPLPSQAKQAVQKVVRAIVGPKRKPVVTLVKTSRTGVVTL